MRRRDFLKTAVIAALTTTAGRHAAAQTAPPRPNIVFIMADDLGYGHLGCYGQEHINTPNLDRLAARGMRFTQCYSGSPVCSPARCSLMTGLHGGHVPIVGASGGVALPGNYRTTAEVLKSAGYATAHFGKWGLGDAGTEGVPTRQGFDEFLGYLHQKHAHYYYTDYLWHNEEPFPLEGNTDGKKTQYSHDVIMDHCLDWIRTNTGEPFFCYLAPTIPHHEWTVPDDSLDAYKGKFEETPPQFHWREGYALPKEPKANMAAMISRLDRDVGRLIDLLEEKGLAENTLVIFTSDNGADRLPLANADFFQANGPLRGYKQDVYEGGIRVPGIACWPGVIDEGVESDLPWYFADVLPTLADLAGAPRPDNIDGRSIAPTLTGVGQQHAHAFMYWERHNFGPNRAIRVGDWKAVWPAPEEPIELYDLATDPGEQHDQAANHPDLIERYRTLIEAQRTEHPPQIEPDAPDGRMYR